MTHAIGALTVVAVPDQLNVPLVRDAARRLVRRDRLPRYEDLTVEMAAGGATCPPQGMLTA